MPPEARSWTSSVYLHITAPTLRFTFKYSKSESDGRECPRYYISHCIPADSENKPSFETGSFSLTLTKNVQLGEELHNDLVNGRCECIVLNRPDCVTLQLLVVSSRGGFSERIGIVDDSWRIHNDERSDAWVVEALSKYQVMKKIRLG
jgi:hypothetical protein